MDMRPDVRVADVCSPVRPCVRACVRAPVRACMRACVRVCVLACALRALEHSTSADELARAWQYLTVYLVTTCFCAHRFATAMATGV